jgi:hypothetical protein
VTTAERQITGKHRRKKTQQYRRRKEINNNNSNNDTQLFQHCGNIQTNAAHNNSD